MTQVFLIAALNIAMLLGMLTLISTMIGRSLPRIAEILGEGGAKGSERPAPEYRYAA